MKSMLIKFWPFKLNSWLALSLLSFIIALPVCSTPSVHTTSEDSVILLTKQAYVYGFPLVMMYETERSAVNHQEQTWGSVFAPINQFGHFRAFPDATFRGVVKPNCDTYYSSAWLDLAQEPLVLTVPDTKGRFYLLQ